jgi:ABC-type amino acid transport substrate-binding protein
VNALVWPARRRPRRLQPRALCLPPEATQELAPTGARAAINFGNTVLAQKDPASGEPRGVSVDLSRAIADVDREGVRIAVSNKSAYDLYLSRTLKRAQLVRAPNAPASIELFVKDRFEAVAGIRQPLVQYASSNPTVRVMDGRFMAIEQAMGTPRGREAGARYLRQFVEEMKASGFVARSLERSASDAIRRRPRLAVLEPVEVEEPRVRRPRLRVRVVHRVARGPERRVGAADAEAVGELAVVLLRAEPANRCCERRQIRAPDAVDRIRIGADETRHDRERVLRRQERLLLRRCARRCCARVAQSVNHCGGRGGSSTRMKLISGSHAVRAARTAASACRSRRSAASATVARS